MISEKQMNIHTGREFPYPNSQDDGFGYPHPTHGYPVHPIFEYKDGKTKPSEFAKPIFEYKDRETKQTLDNKDTKIIKMVSKIKQIQRMCDELLEEVNQMT